MRLVFTPHGREDYPALGSNDRATLKRVNPLIGDVPRDPFTGLGKPEQLRHALAGAWSRRITEKHRLVYLVDGDDVVIPQVRYHHWPLPNRACNARAPGPSTAFSMRSPALVAGRQRWARLARVGYMCGSR